MNNKQQTTNNKPAQPIPSIPSYNLDSFSINSNCLGLHSSLLISDNLISLRKSSQRASCKSDLTRQTLLTITLGVSLITSYSSHALTATTSDIINGNAPYLTFDNGYTHVTNSEDLLWITLSNGTKFTPATNNSSTQPIELPETGESFADINMLVPTDINSIELSSFIGAPYYYWRDDDGDGQGSNGITATGSLRLSIVDKNNQVVERNDVLTICKAPYKLTLSNTDGTLKTLYGVPNESRFNANNVTYYINPKGSAAICFAKPSFLKYGSNDEWEYPNVDFRGPASIWDPKKGFLTQTAKPSSYGLNFPTTGAHNLYFDLDISGNDQVLHWAPVSHSGITATMTNSTKTSVRVTLTGYFATQSQMSSGDPGNIDKPSLPQVFELVGRDSPDGNVVVKYGFELKQWFINRGETSYPNISYTNLNNQKSWCDKIGYRLATAEELTNSNYNNLDSSSPSSDNYYKRQIGAGLFSEWGNMSHYGFDYDYWTSTSDSSGSNNIAVDAYTGLVKLSSVSNGGYAVCIYSPSP